MIKNDNEELLENVRYFQWGHLAMTYTSIGILVTLGDDLSRLDRKIIVDGELYKTKKKVMKVTIKPKKYSEIDSRGSSCAKK